MTTLPIVTRVAAIARRQHGLVTAEQLGELGLSARQIEGWRSNGRLERVLPSVFRLPGAPPTRDQKFAAAALWGGSHALLSHRAGSELWGYDIARAAKPEITVPGFVSRRSKLVVVHQRRVPLIDRRMRHGIPVTTPERTTIDLAGCVTAEQLEIAFESARRERWLTVASVERTLARLETRGREGSRVLQQLLTTLASEPPSESALEVLTARVLRASDLPKPQRQVEVVAGGASYRLDFAWPHALVALESDGRQWHEAAFERDRRRWSAIQATTGYRIVWATWLSITDQPEQIVAEVRQMLGKAA